MHDPRPMTSAEVSRLVLPKERIYFALLLVASAFGWLTILVMLAGMVAVGAGDTKEAETAAGVVLWVPAIAAFLWLSHAIFCGHIKGNGVRVTARQFPALHALVERHARTLGLREAPPAYVIQAGGMLNAFATKIVGRPFVTFYADMVALAEEQGEQALGFVVAHELAHIRRGHLRWVWLTLPGRLVPFLGSAYSRACEYTCDRLAAHCEPGGAVDGLLVLAAGRDLYRRVDARLFAEQVETESGFWVRYAELSSTHPILPKRVTALTRAGVPMPVAAPLLQHASA